MNINLKSGLNLASLGYIWLYVAIFDYIWLYLVIFGQNWLICGQNWLGIDFLRVLSLHPFLMKMADLCLWRNQKPFIYQIIK